jgi:hypothetical protein
MGNRTVIILINDEAHNWQHDPELGDKIWAAASGVHGNRFDYGSVVENVHADCQTLMVMDSYSGKAAAETRYLPGESDKAVEVKLLKMAAEKLGYDLTPKPVTKIVYCNGVARPNTDHIWLDYERGIRQPGFEQFGCG